MSEGVVSAARGLGDNERKDAVRTRRLRSTQLLIAPVFFITTVAWSQTRSRDARANILDVWRTAPASSRLAGAELRRTRWVQTASSVQAGSLVDTTDIAFEANRGQMPEEIEFVSRGEGFRLYLTATDAVIVAKEQFARHGEPLGARVVRMRLVGGDTGPRIEPLGELEGKSHYFRGSDASRWLTDVPRYQSIRYHEVYPGIDLVYTGRDGALAYDIVVAPGGEPDRVRFELVGADAVEVTGEGDLRIHVGEDLLTQRRPRIFQLEGERQKEIEGRFQLFEEGLVGFHVGTYERDRELVIDPELAYSSYLGDSGDDFGCAIAVDGAGNIYVAGWTDSVDFPTTAGALLTAPSGDTDAFVAKLSPAGDELLYSTFIGGGAAEFEFVSIAIDADGNTYVAGSSKSPDYPTTPGAFQTTHRGGEVDIVVTKLDPTGSALVYSTFLGGGGLDGAQVIALDAARNAYVSGFTGSTDFPTTAGAFQTSLGGGPDAFATKLDAAGATLVYSTYLGGSDADFLVTGIALDASNRAYLVGTTESADFPVTPTAFQSALGGGKDAFVVKVDPSGASLAYSSFLGGSGDEEGRSVAVDGSGQIYASGLTESSDFPVTVGVAQTALAGQTDVFLTKLDASGTVALYSTFLGGTGPETSRGFAIDILGNAFVTGATNSPDFPVTADAVQTRYAGGEDVFVTKVNSTGAAVLYSTFLGGGGNDRARNLALDALGDVYIVGFSSSIDFPTQNAFQHEFRGGINNCFFAGGCDAFISKLSPMVPIRVELDSDFDTLSGGEVLPFRLTLTNRSNDQVAFGFTIVLGLPSGDSLSVLPPQPLAFPPAANVVLDAEFGPLPANAPAGTWQLVGLIVLPSPSGPEIVSLGALAFTVP